MYACVRCIRERRDGCHLIPPLGGIRTAISRVETPPLIGCVPGLRTDPSSTGWLARHHLAVPNSASFSPSWVDIFLACSLWALCCSNFTICLPTPHVKICVGNEVPGVNASLKELCVKLSGWGELHVVYCAYNLLLIPNNKNFYLREN